MSDLKNLLKELNSHKIGKKQYLIQFLGLTENFNQIPVLEHLQWHDQTDKIKILITNLSCLSTVRRVTSPRNYNGIC